MIPGSFDYHAPSTVEEAVALLENSGPDTKLLAGGHSLVPAMRFRLAQPATLVDINRIAGLDAIREENGHLVLGALVRESAVERSQLVRDRYPLLADTSKVVADPLVRNRGTVGGNIAHADPANDHPAAMLAYGAEIVAVGPSGKRTIGIDDFFVDLFATALAENEILVEIHIPTPGPGSGGAYVKFERKVGDYAISAVAVQLTMEGETCSAVKIGLTNVNPVPMRATDAEAAIVGNTLSDEVLENAGKAAAAECDPSPDLRGSVEYKRDMTRILTKRAILRAAERAQGGAA
ncbi:MAG: xanthine dehydrogenase family protein subunit M [Thermoanaerobaculia bacterium]